MTAKTTAAATAAEPEYDFDNWSEEDEAKALAALAPDIKHIIVEKNFIGRFPDGTIVKVPLSISLDDVDAMSKDSVNPVDQFKTLLSQVGGDEVSAEFSRHDLTETIAMSERFFTTFSRITSATLPE
ncbi:MULTISPECIES: hypothetical protein [Mycetocola]|uniref:hypothetical protein n=1 Tax=Mycetocola TaxID=76634 RepID=UPI00068E354C|nr:MULTISPECIES: hypothetical protein [Mycetocola]